MEKYTWFVAFMFLKGNGLGFGNIELTTDFSPKDIRGIREFESLINDTVGEKVTIMSYTMLNIEHLGR